LKNRCKNIITTFLKSLNH